MSDDGRSDRRPRVGDATLKRIDDIAEGWKRPKKTGETDAEIASGTPAAEVGKEPPKPPEQPETPGSSEPAASGPAPPEPESEDKPKRPGFAARGKRESRRPQPPAGKPSPRPARKSEPPPPPGSKQRSKSTTNPPAPKPAERVKRESNPPPPPPGSAQRAKRESNPPPPPRSAQRAKRESNPPPPPGSTERAKRQSRPPPTPRSSPDRDEVLRLEDVATVEDREAPRPERPRRATRPPSAHPPAAAAEARAQAAVRKAQRSTGGLRLPTEVPVKRGPLGDIAYALTASLGLRSARRELTRIEQQLKTERGGRRERLIDLGRQAIADPSLELQAVDKARHHIAEIEDRRSRKAGRVAALDAELEAIEAERKRRQKAHAESVSSVENDLAVVISELEPLELELAALRRRTGELKSAGRLLDQKIEKAEARLVEAKQGDVPHEVEADIAAMRAEKQSLVREGPELADKISDLEPEIAGLKASRAELETKLEELHELAKDADVRTREKIEAVTARKAVDDREVADVARERERELRELGASLHELRPPELEARLRGIDQHDEAITTLERRAIELKDKLLRADRGSIVRGFLYLFGIGLVGTVVAILIVR